MDFQAISVSQDISPWCVDGRPDFSKIKGPQMLGGSLHPVLLWLIENRRELNADSLTEGLALLKSKGFGIGVHRDEHAAHADSAENKSGCGFADKTPLILKTALEKQESISSAIVKVYDNNKDRMGEMAISQILENAYGQLANYDPEKIKDGGEKLIAQAEKDGCQVIIMAGDHRESVAFVNLQENSTLDTNLVNQQNNQGFNLDLWMVIKQAKALGVNEDFAIGASLILYVATEIVLVEMNGKPGLPVMVH